MMESNTNNVNAVSSIVNAAAIEVNAVDPKTSIELPNDLNMHELEDIVYLDNDEDVGAEADMNNLDAFMPSYSNYKNTQRLSKEPKKLIQALKNPSWIEPMQDVNSAFLYGKIEEEVYVCQPPGFEDPDFPNRVYKVEKALYGLHQAPRAVNPKVSHLHAVKRIFRYLKGQPKLGLWYPKDSPFDLVAYTDSDYAGANLDRKSTTRGCQFLGCRLISCQCKKQTVVANSITEAEYVAASSCCGQVLWIQNLLLDYGYNFMHTKIYIDNESTICIVKNRGFHSNTKHIEIRHHFIRDSNEKKLIQMLKIHTDKNVADLLTKAFDNVDSSVKFLMYPRFVQVFLDKQVGDMSTHDEIFVTPSHTKKVFSNMKRIGKGFSKAVTPLFPTMMVQAQEERCRLSDRVLDLETTKTAQAKEIANLKKRVKKLERKRKSKTLGMKRLFKIEVFVVEQSEKVVEEVVSTAEVSAAATITIEEITLAQALAELRSAKPKIVDKSQCKADRLLAKRLQAREQEELTDEHKARLFIELLEKRKKHFAALRAQEKRNKPPTKAQKKSTMSAYLKNMAGYKQSQLKNKARKELEQEVAKKQKIDDDQEEAEMKKLIKVAPDEEEVAIDAIPLATKPPSIVFGKLLDIVLQKAKQIQDFGPTSGIKASKGTLNKKNHKNHKQSLLDLEKCLNQEDASDNDTATNKPKQQQQQLTPTTTTISNIKLPILKKEEYDIWAMEMEHYLEYIDNDVWKVTQNGNSKKRISTRKDGVVRVLPPVSATEIHAVKKERKARTILLMAIPMEHLRRFHGMDDAKEIGKAIRTRFGGNANSKKMQKALEAHGAEVSTEDANHKFLRSLPPAWSNLAMTMRTKPDVDTLSIDDLYNNLRVFEQELTSTSKSSASAQNVAFVSHSKSSNNKVKSGHTGPYSTYTPSTSSNNILEREVPAGFADEVIYSLFAKQSEDLDLLREDLEQINDVDIEEMDINWQIAMIAIRMKKFYKKTRRRVRIDGNKPVGFDKKKLECLKCHNTGHFARECTSKGTNDGKKRDLFYQDQGAGKKEQNQNCLLTMDDGMTSNNKVGLWICINQSNNDVLSYEEEMNRTVFKCTEEDFLNKPLYSRFSKTDNFKRVPHPLTRDYTPKQQEGIDDSLYVYGKKGSQKPEISDSDDTSNEHSTCQSNDNE
ncbi:putative reverse transcriptase, RNA-dependent DNA polymerase [Tanacetum coccineum]